MVTPRDAQKAAKLLARHPGYDKLLRTVIERLQEKFLTTTTTSSTTSSTTSTSTTTAP